MGRVYYHHPGDEQFSLDFVNPDPADVVSRIVAYDDVAVKVRRYDLDREFYVVYTSRVGGEAVSDMKFDLQNALAETDDVDGVIIARLLEIYQEIISQNEAEEGIPVKAYKKIDIDNFPDALNQATWDGSATEVAGRLASNLILKHALPNANHRTAVALVQFYLRRIDPNFSMPKTTTEIDTETYDWQDWVNEYINESKRLLTVRRKNVWLKYLNNWGATTLERRHGIEINLTAYELDMYPSEAKKMYATKHEKLWVEFVEEAVERADHADLVDAPGLSKSEFAERIRDTD